MQTLRVLCYVAEGKQYTLLVEQPTRNLGHRQFRRQNTHRKLPIRIIRASRAIKQGQRQDNTQADEYTEWWVD